jgi:hypothetical protein
MLFRRRGASSPTPDAIWLDTIFIIVASGAYQWVISSPMLLNHGLNDEAFSADVVLIPYTYQKAINKNNPIVAVPAAGGNHRGTFLTAVNNQRYWFNLVPGRDPGPPASDQWRAGLAEARRRLLR